MSFESHCKDTSEHLKQDPKATIKTTQTLSIPQWKCRVACATSVLKDDLALARNSCDEKDPTTSLLSPVHLQKLYPVVFVYKMSNSKELIKWYLKNSRSHS